MLYIISANFKEAEQFAETKRIKKNEWRYVFGPLTFRGDINIKFTKIGHWYQRKNIHKIITQLESYIKKGRAEEIFI